MTSTKAAPLVGSCFRAISSQTYYSASSAGYPLWISSAPRSTVVHIEGLFAQQPLGSAGHQRAAETPKGEWVKGSNFDQSKWTDCEDRLPTRLDLDEASTEHPIVIKRVCLHTAVANTMALEKGVIVAGGVYESGKVKATPAMQEAYELGKRV